ncbi:DUF4148 domain-containing protein [Caballeronia sp. DA-9]|uniref:DUF4148 domain-containing protein n=1 Tax=Caballeronia sp. DA-9 TaxID=3436237 RepID=UPI003F6722AC
MPSRKKLTLVVALMTAVVALTSQTTTAQTSDATVSTPKQVERAHRKADRKVARTKKNVELGKLKNNGYDPTEDRTKYPENLQNAEHKAGAEKAASSP